MKQSFNRSIPTLGVQPLGTTFVLCSALLTALLTFFIGSCTPGQSQSPEEETLDLVVADSGAAHPTTAVDPESGAVYVTYTSKINGQTEVYLQRLEARADTLLGPVRVNDVAGDAAAHAQAPAQVAVGPGGMVYVAWVSQTSVEGRRFPASDIRLARSVDGGRTFDKAVTVNQDAGLPTSHHFHNLAVGPDGAVYVSWLDSEARDRASQAREHSGTTKAASSGHEGVHGEQGDEDLPGTQLKVSRSIDGGHSFEPGVVVADGTCQCCRTALSITPEGTVYVVWRHIFGDQIRDMAFARSSDGGRSFSDPVRVHADNWQINGCPHAGPAVAVDEQSRVYVIWYTGVDGRSGVYYASSGDGGKAFGPATALAPGVSIAHVSAVPAGHRGGVLLAWEHPLRESVYVRRAVDANLDSEMSVPGSAPAMASWGNTMALTWRDDARTRLRVMRRREAGRSGQERSR